MRRINGFRAGQSPRTLRASGWVDVTLVVVDVVLVTPLWATDTV
jgi:hypothetical protein